MEDDKIVISGMGVFTSYGRGIELLRRGLLECKRHLISLKNENTQSCNVNLIFDNTSIPNNCIEMLTLSINEALEMACLSLTGKNRTALIIGTGTGNINYFENCIFEDKDFDIDKFCCGSENLLQSIANKYSIDSVVSCISTGCSSSNYALSYASSLSYVDMANLTTHNIEKLETGEYIVYKRQKIKNQKGVKSIKIPLTDTIRELIEWFGKNTPLIGDYLTPIITRDYSGAQLYEHIRSRYGRYNKNLKKLGVALGIERQKLTTYVSRHTMAMTLQSNKVPREVISQVMGHSNLETTNVYLDSFETSVVDEAAKLL